MDDLDDVYLVKMNDGSVWSIPIYVIALHKAITVSKRKENEGIPTTVILNNYILEDFKKNPSKIRDWLVNHMSWQSARNSMVCITPPKNSNYDYDWKQQD